MVILEVVVTVIGIGTSSGVCSDINGNSDSTVLATSSSMRY